MTNQRVRIVRIIPAPREEVFRAWTVPERVRLWFGPGQFTVASAEIDLRPGGEYRILLQPPEGEPMALRGIYREVDPPRRLVFTWDIAWRNAPESLVTVELSEVDGGTEVVVTHGDFDSLQDGEPYRRGWESGLPKLVRVFEAEEASDAAG